MALYRRWIGGSSDLVSQYTSSIDDDREIADEVVKVMRAHVAHLSERGLIPRDAADSILRALDELRPPDLLKPGYEDVHEALEDYLMKRVGPAGGWVGLGRSRNDHVAAAIRLRLIRHIDALTAIAERAACAIAEKALRYADCVMPSFTHFQPAQPITLGHYLLALCELLSDFTAALNAARQIADKSPLGSGPSGGTSAPVDRERLAQLAGFGRIAGNTLYASSSRFFASLAASAVASALAEISRFVDDLIAWSSPLVGYVRAPAEHVSTSSIMPHKRNPVTLEILRARISEALADALALMMVQEKIGYGYSLDLQEATRHLWRVFKTAEEGLEVLSDFISKMDFDCQRSYRDAAAFPTTSSDLAERIALAGTPFREAYFQVAQAVKEGNAQLPDPRDAVRRPVSGGPDPGEVAKSAKEILAKCGR
ncbi:argininosuccinate lyase [Thermoproteus tenax]|uniref:Argininosuccinate lyase n=1 Tax=Thermoproteus tenax (strain ATCC 35583 / DSM 2078 / JCM 9277 / NBRC 100435 / Kra 1) TaxID=768679 RepID=G4RNJ0_THETK|nr:argininosuccinate lyase [Thermoproteus tenax]CCC81134.1 Argininosuccinate lyase [Thermoproteus tenax Kra 1]